MRKVNSSKKQGTNALVLPGGGARGAYQVGVLKAISEMTPNEPGTFPVMCGTSAGAINAAVMASHAHEFNTGVERLETFWSSMRCERIYRTDGWTVLKSGLRWGLSLASGGLLASNPQSLLDNRPLKTFLNQQTQLSGIDTAISCGALQGVAVTASAYSRATAVSFFQAAGAVEEWQRNRRQGQRDELTVDHLMASAALPLLFPAERIGMEYYGDGGMRMLAPLSPAIHLGADRLLVITTRDEKADPAPLELADYPSLGEIGGYLLDTIFMDTLNADLGRLNRVNQLLSFMDEESREKTGLRQVDTLVIRPSRDLRQLTQEHVSEIPRAVRLLLRSLGGWGRDWRMASYLLFESDYCRELISLGYQDGLAHEDQIRSFAAGRNAGSS